jgi:hypothetical protein
MRTKRKPKTLAENVSHHLNRKTQLEAMKKALLEKATERSKASKALNRRDES